VHLKYDEVVLFYYYYLKGGHLPYEVEDQNHQGSDAKVIVAAKFSMTRIVLKTIAFCLQMN